MADRDLTRPAFRYSSAGRRPERLNQSRDVNVPVQLARDVDEPLQRAPSRERGNPYAA